MTEDGFDDTAERDAEARCSLSAPLARATDGIAKLTRMIESGELMSSLRRLMLLDAVHHGGRSLSPHDADVVEKIARLARPIPFSRLAPREVASLQRLARAGLVNIDHGVLRVTPRGRAVASARARERSASKRELGRVRDALARISL